MILINQQFGCPELEGVNPGLKTSQKLVRRSQKRKYFGVGGK